MIMWSPSVPDARPSPEEMRIHGAVETALVAQGYRFVPDAPLALMATLSQRPAAIGISAGRDESAFSPAHKQRLLQNCANRLVRADIAIIERAKGNVLFAGSAEEAHCHASLSEVVGRLGSAAVADIGHPHGTRSHFTFARD